MPLQKWQIAFYILLLALIAIFAAMPFMEKMTKKELEQKKAIYRVLNKKKGNYEVPLPKDLTIGFVRENDYWYSSTTASDQDVARLADSENVDKIKISQADITGKTIQRLADEPLQSLMIVSCDLEPEFYEQLHLLKDLNSLQLERYLDDGKVLRIKGPANLKELNLSFSSITDRSIEHVAKTFPHLEKLVLKGCRRLSPKSLDLLASIPGLKELDITYCSIKKSKSLGQQLLRLKSLKVLHLDEGDITSNTTKQLSPWKLQLTELELINWNFSEKRANDLKTMIRKSKNLKTLYLTDCKLESGVQAADLNKLRPELKLIVKDRGSASKGKGSLLIKTILDVEGKRNQEEQRR